MATREARRILIVEDEFLVAMLLEDLLSEMGHRVVTCIARIDKAMQFADDGDIDFAILDVNLGGQQSFPVAEILRRRGIPFVFATGYGANGVSDEFRNELTLQKPYEPRELEQAIKKACTRLAD